MQASLYAANYPKRRREALLRSEGRCEQLLENGQRCSHRIGVLRISRAGNPLFEQLLVHHPNQDPWNPEAELLVVCSRCHMRLHRQPSEPGKKAAARKHGYHVMSLDHLNVRLQDVGLLLVPTEEGRIRWQAGPFEAEAEDVVTALTMAAHWLIAEVSDTRHEIALLQAALAQAGLESPVKQHNGGRRA